MKRIVATACGGLVALLVGACSVDSKGHDESVAQLDDPVRAAPAAAGTTVDDMFDENVGETSTCMVTEQTALAPITTKESFADGSEQPAASSSSTGASSSTGGPVDPCSDEAKKDRLKREKEIAQDFVKNKCLPASFGEEPCKALYDEWVKLKNQNAECNAKAKCVTVCDYLKGLNDKYEKIKKDNCTPPKGEVPPEMKPMTVEQYCDYGQATLDLVNQRLKDLKCD